MEREWETSEIQNTQQIEVAWLLMLLTVEIVI